MKPILIAMITMVWLNTMISQSYSVSFNNGTSTRWIHIRIDTSFEASGIFVEKEFETSSVDTILYQNTLLLLGDFNFNIDSAKLDYDRYNYFWIPFEPSAGFYVLDQIYGSSVHDGSVYFGGNGYSGGVDIIYWCDCGGHTGVNDTPAGCLSQLSGKKVRCVEDGSSCHDSCIASIEGNTFANPGGGILIQVGSAKSRLSGNFGTGH